MQAPNEAARLQRQAKVAELYSTGETMRAIALQLSVSLRTVYKDICWANEQARSRAVESIEIHRQRELGKLDHIEYEAWRGWKRSIGKKVTLRTETGTGTIGGGKLGNIDKEFTETHRDAGDPRFLDIGLKCVESRRKILGLDAPVKTMLSNPDGSNLLSGIKVIEVGKPTA
jgi:hypothetical protein